MMNRRFFVTGVLFLVGVLAVVFIVGKISGVQAGLYEKALNTPKLDPVTRSYERLVQDPSVVNVEFSYKFGGGWFSISSNDDAPYLWSGDYFGPSHARISSYHENEGMSWRVTQKSGMWWANRQLENHWHTGFNSDTNLNLELILSSTGGHIDLTNLSLSGLSIKMYRSHIKLIVDSTRENYSPDITAINSTVSIVIPEDIGVRVNMNGFYNRSDLLKLDWTKEGSTYYSPDYLNAEKTIEIDIKMFFSSLSIV